MSLRRLWSIAGFCLYLTMIAWGAIPGETQRLFGATSDKLLHFGAYGILACCFYLGREGSRRARGGWTVVVIAMLGLLDEVIQRFEPHRTSDVRDWAVDVTAALAVALLGAWWQGRQPRIGTTG